MGGQQKKEEVEALANALALNLQLEESRAEGSVRGDESEQRGVDLGIERSSSGEQQQVVQQADGLNSFARQLEEQLTSCHREKPLGLEANQPLHSDLVDDNETIQQTEKLLERKELLGRNLCQECKAVLPSVSLLGYHYCKHFQGDLAQSRFSHMYKDKMCLSCEETFYDRETLLSHLGVKHNLINRVLKEKGFSGITLDQVISEQVVSIKREPTFVEPQNSEQNCQTETQLSANRSQCEVCGATFLATNKLAQHMCAHFMGQLRALESLYSDLTCLSCEFAFTTEHALLLHIGLKHRKINEILAAEGKQPLLLANIRPLANKRGSLDLKEAALAVDAEMRSNPTSCEKFTPDAPRKEVRRKGGIGSDISGEEGENMKKKVKQGKKKTELKVNEKLVEEKVDPETNFVQMRGKEKKLKIEKGKRGKKGKFEKEKKKGVHSCAQCTKEFKFPTLLAEHYVADHFMDRLKVEAKLAFEGSHCLQCSRESGLEMRSRYKKEVQQARHLGMLHGRLNALLVEAGLHKVNFRIYGSRSRAMPQQRISRAGLEEGKGLSEEKPEKIASQSSPAQEVADAKEGDREEEETEDEEAAAVDEKLAKSPPHQTRPLPFVDETAQEEE